MGKSFYTSVKGRRKHITQKQLLFLSFYTDPASDTFDNAFRSGLKAGYSTSTSQRLKHEDHIKDLLQEQRDSIYTIGKDAEARRVRILAQAEINLEEYVTSNPQDKTDKTIKADMTKFTAERLAKDHYSTRTEAVVDDNAGFLRGARADVIDGTFSRYLAPSAERDAPRLIDTPAIKDTKDTASDTKNITEHE